VIAAVAALVAGSYIVGSIPMGLLVGKARGVDLRRCGSGNIGATNAGRVLGRKFGILVFALDAGKGASCTALAGMLAPLVTHGRSEYRDIVWVGAAMAAILGNMFSVFLSFRGGKGVGTSLGAVLGIYPYLTFPGVLAGFVWLLVVKISRYVSLASMAAVAVFPALFVGLSLWLGWPVREHTPLLVLSIAMPVLVLLRHKDNISRLLSGTENRVGNSGRSQSPN
jgi:acyl phosphate:glycerol-3-phosphate acyltransferase